MILHVVVLLLRLISRWHHAGSSAGFAGAARDDPRRDRAAMTDIVESQLFILGAAVEQLEREVAALSHTKYADRMRERHGRAPAGVARARRRPRRRSHHHAVHVFRDRGHDSQRRRTPVFVDIDPETFNILPEPPPPFSPRRFVTHEISGGDGHGYIMVAEVPPAPLAAAAPTKASPEPAS